MADILADDLNTIPFVLRVATNIGSILISLENEFALTANYAKGHGCLFRTWMMRFHTGALLFPILRVTAGTPQDSGTEGAIIAYMNRLYYVQVNLLFMLRCTVLKLTLPTLLCSDS